MQDPALEQDSTTEMAAAHHAALVESAGTARGEVLLARIIDFTRLLWELGMDVGAGRVLEIASRAQGRPAGQDQGGDRPRLEPRHAASRLVSTHSELQAPDGGP